MKKTIIYLLMGASLMSLTNCDSLDVEPVSSITDNNYWKSEAHFTAFNQGIHALFRERSYDFFRLGEVRCNIYGGTDSFGGEAAQGNSLMPLNALNANNVGIGNYASMYTAINQINLMIAKTTDTEILTEETKNYYLGETYGMRAFLYFQLLRSWGAVIIHSDYTSGTSLDLANLAKGVSSEEEVMQFIKDDIQASEKAFNNNYSFKLARNHWSLPATKVLKGEVYLWSGKQMGGGSSDYQTAKTALEDVKNADVELINDFSKIFAYDNKLNKEIIFAIHNGKDEFNLWNDSWRANMVPQQAYLPNFCTAEGISFGKTPLSDVNGMIKFQLRDDVYHKVFREGDTRRDASLVPVYKKEDNVIKFVSCFAFKYQGVLLDGASLRSFLEDAPVYRYADCLLLLAEAKALLGEDPAAEINAVRKRAYGEEYFNQHQAEVAYPNDNKAVVTDLILGDIDVYSANKYIKPDNAGALETVLKERLRELMFEGKRWYDIRLAGWDYVHAYSLAEQHRMLWPINQDVLTNNTALKQTPGY